MEPYKLFRGFPDEKQIRAQRAEDRNKWLQSLSKKAKR